MKVHHEKKKKATPPKNYFPTGNLFVSNYFSAYNISVFHLSKQKEIYADDINQSLMAINT